MLAVGARARLNLRREGATHIREEVGATEPGEGEDAAGGAQQQQRIFVKPEAQCSACDRVVERR